MFDPTRPVLVATGDKTVDAYLATARQTYYAQRGQEMAEQRLAKAESWNRDRLEVAHAERCETNAAAWDAEQQADQLAQAKGDPRMYALALAEITTGWDELYSLDRPAWWPPAWQTEVFATN